MRIGTNSYVVLGSSSGILHAAVFAEGGGPLAESSDLGGVLEGHLFLGNDDFEALRKMAV